MTGNRFDGPDRPGDFTGNLARKLAREHKERVDRERSLAQEAEARKFDSSQFDEQVIDYTGYWAGWTPPADKTRNERGRLIDDDTEEEF